MLKHLGHQTAAAGKGEEGIAMFEEAIKSGTPFDLVITDLGMPKVSGTEVVQKVKEISPNTPVIVVTGWGAEQRPTLVDYAFSKPVRLSALREAIAKTWTQKQKRDEDTSP